MNRFRPIEDILLIYLSQDDADYLISGKLDYGIKRVPKLGFMYLAAVLEQKGIRCHIMDQTLQPFTFKDLVDRLDREDFGFIGFYSATALKSKLITYIQKIRGLNIDIPILVGGPGYFSAREYLEAGCDIVCRGEGEITICEIVDYLNGKRDIEDVKGVYYLEDNQLKANQNQDLIKDLDSLPFPRRDSSFREGKFYDFHIFNMRTPYTTMITSRGCLYRCTYCSSHNVWENKVRMRSPENVIEEIEDCIEKFSIRYIGFRDDMFGMDKRWLERFCELTKRLKYKVLWSAMVHPFSFREDRSKTLKMLKDAGCDMLIFGLQSAHPEILKNIRRSPSEPSELAETVKMAKRNNISTVIEFIFGLPGETRETMLTSIDYILRVRPHYAQFNALSVLEGSEIEEQLKDHKICGFSKIKINDWCKSASRKFYTNPPLVLQDFVHVLSKNPLWFFRIAKHTLYLITYLGFNRARY